MQQVQVQPLSPGPFCALQMADALESQAVFKARLQAIGVSAAGITSLEGAGITSMGRLAFCCPGQPGSSDDQPFRDFLTSIWETAPVPPGELASLRRAYFEAHTLLIADIRSKVERTDDTQPKPLPLHERSARLTALQKRLTGVRIEGVMEPSTKLINIVFQLKQDDSLRYVEPSDCTSRDAELQGVKKEQVMRITTEGTLVAVSKANDEKADLSTELRIRQALARRALAFELVNLLPFEVMERWHDFLFLILARQVPDGYQSVTGQQILLADRQLWVTMANLTRDGICQQADGAYPLEQALKQARDDPFVLSSLQPLAKGVKRPAEHEAPQTKPRSRNANSVEKTPRSPAKRNPTGRKAAKQTVPQAYKGLHPTNPAGQRICFGFNLDGCKFSPHGKTCPKGLHICGRCFGDHSAKDCPSSKTS